mmetsp:Transcript_29522/g.70304  ORF Transcript_29522/g.70304 Transcript_29522/m.70304 type:complete len:550 (-) Transcript_29522:936-2585(-)
MLTSAGSFLRTPRIFLTKLQMFFAASSPPRSFALATALSRASASHVLRTIRPALSTKALRDSAEVVNSIMVRRRIRPLSVISRSSRPTNSPTLPGSSPPPACDRRGRSSSSSDASSAVPIDLACGLVLPAERAAACESGGPTGPGKAPGASPERPFGASSCTPATPWPPMETAWLPAEALSDFGMDCSPLSASGRAGPWFPDGSPFPEPFSTAAVSARSLLLLPPTSGPAGPLSAVGAASPFADARGAAVPTSAPASCSSTAASDRSSGASTSDSAAQGPLPSPAASAACVSAAHSPSGRAPPDASGLSAEQPSLGGGERHSRGGAGAEPLAGADCSRLKLSPSWAVHSSGRMPAEDAAIAGSSRNLIPNLPAERASPKASIDIAWPSSAPIVRPAPSCGPKAPRHSPGASSTGASPSGLGGKYSGRSSISSSSTSGRAESKPAKSSTAAAFASPVSPHAPFPLPPHTAPSVPPDSRPAESTTGSTPELPPSRRAPIASSAAGGSQAVSPLAPASEPAPAPSSSANKDSASAPCLQRATVNIEFSLWQE